MVDYETLIFSVIFSAIIGAISAILVYNYQFFKEKKHEFLQMQITELLLPLYVELKNWESCTDAIAGHPILENFGIDESVIDETIKKKLYFASPKLKNLLLKYLSYKHLRTNPTRATPINYQEVIDHFEELKQAVYDEYENKVEEFQRILG